MSMAATEDTRFNAWEWLWPLCKKTLPDAIVGAHPSTVPGALPLQAVHSSKSARLCLTRTGLRTRQPKGSRTTCSLRFEHTQRLATCEPLRAPILDWGPKPSFRPCDSGSCSQLSLSCMASCRSRKTVRVAESGIENGPGKHGRTRPHSSIIQRRQNITAIPSPVPDPIPMPNSNFARLPQRSLPRPWKSNGTVVSPSARLLVSWSTRLHVFSRRLLVYHWLQCDGGDLVWMGRLLFTGAVLAAPRCCAAWDTWGWGL